MASVGYPFEVVKVGVLQTGQEGTLVWSMLKRISDQGDVAVPSRPAFVAIGGGLYVVFYDPEVLGEAVGIIDCGASFTNPSERYIRMTMTRDSSRIGLALPNAATGAAGGIARHDDLSAVATALAAIPGLIAAVPAAAWAVGSRTLTAIADSAGITTLLGRLTDPRATALDNLDAPITSRLGTAGYTAPNNAGIAAIQAILSGITNLGHWLRAMLRISTPDATALAEINAGAPPGTYDPALDSQQAAALAIADIPEDVVELAGFSSPDPDKCRVAGYELSGSGSPVAGRIITARLQSPPQESGTAILETERVTTQTGSNGYWYLDLPREYVYRFTIPEATVEQDVTIPDAAEAWLTDLLT